MIAGRLALPAAAALLLAAGCHARTDDPSAAGAEEQAQLNDAAASLDANAVPADAVDANADADDDAGNATDRTS